MGLPLALQTARAEKALNTWMGEDLFLLGLQRTKALQFPFPWQYVLSSSWHFALPLSVHREREVAESAVCAKANLERSMA